MSIKKPIWSILKVIVKANLVCNIKDLKHFLVLHITYSFFRFLVQNYTLMRGHVEAMKEAEVNLFKQFFLVNL